MSRLFVTSGEVAKAAGVSRSTVSRVFAQSANVSPEVRDRVREAAKSLGYRVNRLAQTLKGEQSHLVGIVGSNLSSPFAAQQLDQLSLGLLRRGMQCLLLNAADADEDVSPLIELILEFQVRAIVVMSGAPPSAIFDECLANGVRVILVNREVDVEADTVRSDNSGGVKLAAERLLRAGCRRPAVVCGAATQSQTRRRNEFLKVMFDADLEPAIWSQGQTSYETGGHAARELIRSHEIDGVFCVTDLLALGFLDAAKSLGVRVPDDVSVVGFDDIPQARWEAYRLTTIRQPIAALTEAVLAAIERDPDVAGGAVVHHVLPADLIERSTVR